MRVKERDRLVELIPALIELHQHDPVRDQSTKNGKLSLPTIVKRWFFICGLSTVARHLAALKAKRMTR